MHTYIYIYIICIHTSCKSLALCIGKGVQHAPCNWTLHHALAICTMPLPIGFRV